MSATGTIWPEPQGDRAEALAAFLAGLDLHPPRLALFDQALTHSSYAFENASPGDNERLEFLGDTVIGFVVAEWLFSLSPDAGEGILSKQKAIYVSRYVLGRCAEDLGLSNLLLLGKGDLRTAARRRSSVLGSALEALVGAAHLELDFGSVRRMIIDHIAIPSHAYVDQVEMRDYKSALQECVQQRFHETPHYRIVSEVGPDHEKLFKVEVLIRGQSYGCGEGKRRKTAENQAAHVGLETLKGQFKS